MIRKHDPAHHRHHNDENANPEAGADFFHFTNDSTLRRGVKQAQWIRLPTEHAEHLLQVVHEETECMGIARTLARQDGPRALRL